MPALVVILALAASPRRFFPELLPMQQPMDESTAPPLAEDEGELILLACQGGSRIGALRQERAAGTAVRLGGSNARGLAAR